MSPSAESDWRWVNQPRGPLASAGCLTFVRDADVAEVIAAFGADPARARELTGEQLVAEMREHGSTHRWIRVARVDGWTAVIEELGLTGSLNRIAERLSAGRESVTVTYTEHNVVGVIKYFVDRELVTMFEPIEPWDRAGREPDRFLAAMRAAGLDVDRTAQNADLDLDDDEDEPDELLLALDVLTAELGIRLPAEVAAGPMLTARLDDR